MVITNTSQRMVKAKEAAHFLGIGLSTIFALGQKWKQSAFSDLKTIVAYIADDNIDAAQSFFAEVQNKIRSLQTFPLQGTRYKL